MLGSLLTSLRLSDPDFDTRLTNPLADHGFKHATQDTALTVHRPFSLHGRGIAVENLSDALTLAGATL